jgi:hypothetical protein
MATTVDEIVAIPIHVTACALSRKDPFEAAMPALI